MQNEWNRSTYDELIRVIRFVRSRWRLKVGLTGAAIVLAAGFLVFALSALGMEYFRYAAWSVVLFRLLTYASLAALVAKFLVLPLTRKVTDEQVALYVEEHEPSIQMAIVSAVEAGAPREGAPRPETSPVLVRKLIETAIQKCAVIEHGYRVDRPRLRQLGGILAGVAAAAVIAVLLSPAFLRTGAGILFAPWNTARAASPYSIDVDPGNASLARGADQKVTAHLQGFDAERVEIAMRVGEQGKWERVSMVEESEPASFSFLLFDLKDKTDYYVESEGVRSAVFHLDVSDLPYVHQVDLEYHFPAYTGLSPQKVEDGGDIAVLAGTEVFLRAQPTFKVRAGRLVVDGQAPVGLQVGDDGVLSGSFKVTKEGFYKIELETAGGAMHVASPEYTIEVLKDLPPTVMFLKPGRDTKATKVDEVFAEVRAEDDYALAKIEIVYSVNGDPEKHKELFRAASEPRKQLSAGHTFFLEEYGLKDGDFISYFATASDRGAPSQESTTDIYFMEVRPFGKEYRQAESQGGMGGAGGADQNLSLQQKEIVAATFKLIRDRKTYSDKEYAENLATLALMQGRLREQVENLLRRMGNRGVLETDSNFGRIAEDLKAAVQEMIPAEENLGARKPAEALPPEQRALQHLQRAEATFREVQVSFGGGGAGGGQQTSAEDLADLFELELDKLQNQYETVERGQRQQVDNQIDEALQRLQELARRQQAENERMKRLASNLQQQGGGGGSAAQRDLIRETEELARKLEKLAREKSQPQMQDTARRLKEAADAMKRSAGNRSDKSVSDGIAALDRLKDARRLLEKNRNVRLERDVQDAKERAQQIASEQQKIQEEVQQLGQGGGNRSERVERLMERKDQLASEVADLESQMDTMARESRREQKDASRKLQEAANSIRDNKLKEKIRYSKGVVQGRSPDYAQKFEEQIGANIEDLKQKIEEAGRAVGAGDKSKAAESLDKTRDLVRQMESLRERIEDKARQNAQRGLKKGDRGEKGDPRQAEGQKEGQEAGEQQGQESQQGREGKQGQKGQQGQQGQQGQDGQKGQKGQQGQQGQQQGSGQEGQGQEQGGPDPGRSRLSANGLGGTDPGSERGGQNFQPGTFSSDDIRQLRREFRERVKEAEELRQDLNREGRQTVDLQNIIERMKAFDANKVYLNPLGIDELQAQVIEGLKQFEYSLRREVEGGGKEKLFLSSSDEVPSGYRKLVEEYYRSLSKKPR